jgi:hypothetical protein
MVRLSGRYHPVSRLRGRGPHCGAVRLSGVLGSAAPTRIAAGRCGAITLSHVLASLQGRSASPGPCNPGVSGHASAGLSLPLPVSEASGAPWAGSRLPSTRRVEACPPRHGRAGATADARVAPRPICGSRRSGPLGGRLSRPVCSRVARGRGAGEGRSHRPSQDPGHG